MYVELVKIADNAAFIDACKSMGWDETNYKEVYNEINDVDGFIVNYNSTKKSVSGTVVDDVEVLYTIGSPEGNRWFETAVVATRTKNGRMWATEKRIDEACC